MRGATRVRGRVVLLAGLAAVGCTPESETATCAVSDTECAEDARLSGLDVVLVDSEGNPVGPGEQTPGDAGEATIPGEGPIWWMDEGDTRIEGTIGLFGRGEGRLAVQLVSDDAVNLLIVMPEEGGAEREVEDAVLSFGRGPACQMVRSAPPFHVRLVAIDGPWLAGRYAGTLACPDSLRVVRGAFRVATGAEG